MGLLLVPVQHNDMYSKYRLTKQVFVLLLQRVIRFKYLAQVAETDREGIYEAHFF